MLKFTPYFNYDFQYVTLLGILARFMLYEEYKIKEFTFLFYSVNHEIKSSAFLILYDSFRKIPFVG